MTVPEVSRVVARAIDLPADWTAADLKAATMLHTEACLRMLGEGRPDAKVHAEAAAALLRAAVVRDGGERQFAIRWLETFAGLLRTRGAPALERELHAAGNTWWPAVKAERDARTAFDEGLRSEIQAAVAGPLSGRAPRHVMPIPPEAVRALRNAETSYAQALGLDPRHAEAALHRGRVLLVLGDDVEAARMLRFAATAHNPFTVYLASMFLGAVAERAGQLNEAIAQYSAASAQCRWAQTAALALSQALMRADRDTDARAAVLDRFTASDRRTFDPFWTYFADPATDLGPTLDALRAEVWR
jgi:tetratricopeptide (TPR) repeat protein